jgi:hypothetical protein
VIEVAQEPAPVTYAKAATIDKVITEVVSAGVQTKTETHVQPVVMRKEGLDAAKKRRQAAVRSINNPLEMVSGRQSFATVQSSSIRRVLIVRLFEHEMLTRLVHYSAS